jgi:hypothetical protein
LDAAWTELRSVRERHRGRERRREREKGWAQRCSVTVKGKDSVFLWSLDSQRRRPFDRQTCR